MDPLTEFLAILLGVVASIVLPIVVQWMALPKAKRDEGIMRYALSVFKPYILAGIAAIIVSFFILMFAPADLADWRAASILGLGWQSFLKSLIPA